MTPVEFLISEVPDPIAAQRFLRQLKEKHPSVEINLVKNTPLLSDVLVLVSCSPLFATTLLQDPEHLNWLDRERRDSSVRDKQSLLESLARFSMTHSLLDSNVVLARFRRRELMRIFLKDVRRLATVAEVTDEISNLADAILEHALRLSRQDLDNRFGQPQETDERGRRKAAEFCVVSLGKLGSKELNYSSDIDLLFIFSENGQTSGTGSKGSTSNLEYFSKLAEAIIKLVGGQGGEGAAYRVDLRLRPHGRVGPLALPLRDTIRYYQTEAAAWERQVLIRSRTSAGSERIFHRFTEDLIPFVFSKEVTVEDAYRNVGLSKQKIDQHRRAENGIDIKLGRGGIREIEFISQALQLAFGGLDAWLRVPHTLVSLDRLADRGYLQSKELTQLFESYEFLRRLEHILQIENGLQTHSVPGDSDKRSAISSRMNYGLDSFDKELQRHLDDVSDIFRRVFGSADSSPLASTNQSSAHETAVESSHAIQDQPEHSVIETIGTIAPRFAEVIAAHPKVVEAASALDVEFPDRDYLAILSDAVNSVDDYGSKLCELRRCWYRQLTEIVAFDVQTKLPLDECKTAQTRLAEASIGVALQIAKIEVSKRFPEIKDASIAILGLGKLGSGSIDYFSDLDLIVVHESDSQTPSEALSRLVESFTDVLSSVTRDGSLYRVDLRLRPHGSDGPLTVSSDAIANYFREDAAIWELLAFVKLRAVGGDSAMARSVENKVRNLIHDRGMKLRTEELRSEAKSVRQKLEKRNAGGAGNNVDFKYGEGGLLDVYFAVRYAQLRFGIRDEEDDRSTTAAITRIAKDIELENVSDPNVTVWASMRDGYVFLSELDHAVRMVVGRSSRLPIAKPKLLEKIACMVGINDVEELLKSLQFHRITVREAFEKILGT